MLCLEKTSIDQYGYNSNSLFLYFRAIITEQIIAKCDDILYFYSINIFWSFLHIHFRVHTIYPSKLFFSKSSDDGKYHSTFCCLRLHLTDIRFHSSYTKLRSIFLKHPYLKQENIALCIILYQPIS